LSYKTNFDKIDLKKYFFDDKAADAAVRYIESRIRHVKGELAGQLFKLEEWQKNEIVRPLFGWKVTATGLRKYNSAYIEIPKKSGKSFLAASIACIFLDIEKEGGSEIVGVAWGRKQAGLVFDATKEVIKKSPELNEKCTIYRNSITAPDHIGGLKSYKILSKEAGGEDGINPQLAIIDELHVHKNGEVVEMVEKSMASRRQPLSFIITTAGSDLYGIGYERSQYAQKVAKGIIKNERMLVCIYCADSDDDPYKESTWKKANPNYGISVYKNAYETEAAKAKISSASLNSFKRYYLNIWTASTDGWINDDVWQSSSSITCLNSKDIIEQVQSLGLDKYPCFGGLDLSSRSDVTAFSLVFKVDKKYYSLNWFWLPETKEGRSEDMARLYYDWVKSGFIIETPGNTIDYDFILHEMEQIKEAFNVECIAYDAWNSQHIAPQLYEMGFNLVEFRQGYKSMSLPTKELESLVLGKNFEHFANPVLRWMAGNAETMTDPAGNVKVIKDAKRPQKKVDGIISNIMAFGLWLNEPEKETKSYLETNDLFIL
jgi:phage terminase large subunit-like protein